MEDRKGTRHMAGNASLFQRGPFGPMQDDVWCLRWGPQNSKEHIDILEHGDLTKKNPGKMMENIGTWWFHQEQLEFHGIYSWFIAKLANRASNNAGLWQL